MSEDRVSIEQLCEEVQRRVGRGDVTYEEIAARLKWMRHPNKSHPSPSPDTSRLKRRLGLIKYISHGKPFRQKTLDAEMAAKIARSAGIYPRDVGL